MFQILWLQTAVNELTAVWRSADPALRQRILDALRLLDRELTADPLRESESRDEDRRVFFVWPLGVEFVADEDMLLVRVLHVWCWTARNR